MATKIRLDCPHCRARLGVDGTHAGKKGLCPTCHQQFQVPGKRKNDYPVAAPYLPVAARVAVPSLAVNAPSQAPPERRIPLSRPRTSRRLLYVVMAGAGFFCCMLILAAILWPRSRSTGVEVTDATPAAATLSPVKLAPDEIISRHGRSLAVIQTPQGGGLGFVIEPGQIATAARVVEMSTIEQIRVSFLTGETVDLLVEHVGVRGDTAILKVNTDRMPLPVSTRTLLHKGDFVSAITRPASGKKELDIRRGAHETSVTMNGRPRFKARLSLDAACFGAPVFDDCGEVIGVALAQAESDFLFLSPASEIEGAADEIARQAPEVARKECAQHELSVVARRIAAVAQVHRDLLAYRLTNETKFADSAGLQKATRDQAVRLLKAHGFQRLEQMEGAYLSASMPAFGRLEKDKLVSPAAWESVLKLWVSCLELKESAAASPADDVDRTRRAHELVESHERLVKLLRSEHGLLAPDGATGFDLR